MIRARAVALVYALLVIALFGLYVLATRTESYCVERTWEIPLGAPAYINLDTMPSVCSKRGPAW